MEILEGRYFQKSFRQFEIIEFSGFETDTCVV